MSKSAPGQRAVSITFKRLRNTVKVKKLLTSQHEERLSALTPNEIKLFSVQGHVNVTLG